MFVILFCSVIFRKIKILHEILKDTESICVKSRPGGGNRLQWLPVALRINNMDINNSNFSFFCGQFSFYL